MCHLSVWDISILESVLIRTDISPWADFFHDISPRAELTLVSLFGVFARLCFWSFVFGLWSVVSCLWPLVFGLLSLVFCPWSFVFGPCLLSLGLVFGLWPWPLVFGLCSLPLPLPLPLSLLVCLLILYSIPAL